MLFSQNLQEATPNKFQTCGESDARALDPPLIAFIYTCILICPSSATPVHVQIHFNLISPITTINLRCMHF